MKNSSHIDILKAISPLEALNLQTENIHPGIFECINELLVQKLRKSHSEEKCQAYIAVSELSSHTVIKRISITEDELLWSKK